MVLKKKRNKVQQIFSVNAETMKTFKKICIDKEIKYSSVIEKLLKDYIDKESKPKSFIPTFFD